MKILWKHYIVLAAFFLCSMILFFNLVPRWNEVSPNLVLNGAFTEDYKHWTLHGQGSNYLQKDLQGTRLHLTGKYGTFQGISQEIRLPDIPSLYAFSFTAQVMYKTKKQCPFWHNPSVFMVYKDSLGNPVWKDMRILRIFSKNQKNLRTQRILDFPDGVKSVFFVTQIDGAEADYVSGDFELKAVSPAPVYQWIERAFILSGFFLFIGGIWLLPSEKYKWLLSFFLVSLLAAMILPNTRLVYLTRIFWDWSTAAPVIKAALSNPWSLQNNPHISPDTSLSFIKALSHFCSFTLICIGAFAVYSRYSPVRVFSSLIFYALFSELIQNFTVSRYAEWNGFQMNLLGLISGLIISLVYSVFQKTPRDPKGKVSNGIVFYSKTLVFYGLFIISIIVESVILHLFPLLFKKDAWYYCNAWGRFINRALLIIGEVKIEVRGQPSSELSPALLIVNHTGPWETVGFMPFYPVKLVYVIKKELLSWKYSFFAWGLKALHPIPISREANSGDFNMIRDYAARHFNEQKHVLIFPGGTRSALRESIEIPPVGILLAKKLKCRVVPVFIDTEAWGRGKYIKDWGMIYPGTITISFGEPISAGDIASLPVRENHDKVLAFYKKELEFLSKF